MQQSHSNPGKSVNPKLRISQNSLF